MRKILLLLFVLSSNLLHAQQKTEKEYKNTIKYNITNPFLFGKNVHILGYERVLNKHRSISINLGTTSLPKFTGISSDSLSVIGSNKNAGFHAAVEYRFYLGKENKYNAPRGVYLAPYYSFNSFQKQNTWSLNTSNHVGNVNTDISLNIHTIGAELGYQFVLWNRLSLDFVLMGPGVAAYTLKTGFDTELPSPDKLALLEKINNALADKLPGYNFVIPDDFAKTGSSGITSFNFRYLVQIGYRF
ncbi:MAG: DUF3575 domain-containing protein [Bacteroidota bacterium]